MTTQPAGDPVGYSHDGALMMDGRALEEVARRYGTPLFVGSRARLLANVERFRRAFAGDGQRVILAYSTKTNSNLGVLHTLNAAEVFASVCSGLDYTAARQAGFPPERVIFNGLVKDPRDLARAIDEGVALINAESWDELMVINELGRQRGRPVPVGLRLRLGPAWWQRPSLKHLLGFSYDRFGVDARAADEVLERARRLAHVRVEGLLVHDGSHLTSARAYRRRIRRLRPMIRAVAGASSGTLTSLNLGGGFGVSGVTPYTAGDVLWNVLRHAVGLPTASRRAAAPVNLEAIAAGILAELTTTCRRAGLPRPTLVVEPGRWLVGDAFVLVCKVVLRKPVPRSGTWLILDAGTNLFPHLVAFTEHHRIVPLRRPAGRSRELVHLAGPLLYSSDVLRTHCALPRLEAGALLAILDAGAYTLAYSNQFLHPRPAAVLLDGSRATQVVRVAETAHDVLQHDRVGAAG